MPESGPSRQGPSRARKPSPGQGPARPLFRLVYKLSNWRRWDAVKRLRGRYYSGLLSAAGEGLRVGQDVRVYRPEMVSVGDSCYLGDGVQLYPWNATITLGNHVLVAAGARMITRKHGFAELDRPMADQGYTNAPIVIEDDVWIGFQSVILPGVTIGQGSIVGAGSVVTRDVAPHSIVGGVPARLIRVRSSGTQSVEST
jgi:maltose O-acetyltransferase